jgi:hypothetical protein
VPTATRYRLRLVRAGAAGRWITTAATSRKLKSLKGHTQYQVQVAAVTGSGLGEAVTLDFTTS